MEMTLYKAIVGIVHLGIAFILSMLATYGTYRIASMLSRDFDGADELNANNIAAGVLFSSVLISAAIILHAVIDPAVSTFEAYFYEGMTFKTFVSFIGYFLTYIAAAIAITVAALWITIASFVGLTRRIDEFREIRSGNVAVAIVLGVAVVIIGCFLSGGVEDCLNALVPIPEMQDF